MGRRVLSGVVMSVRARWLVAVLAVLALLALLLLLVRGGGTPKVAAANARAGRGEVLAVSDQTRLEQGLARSGPVLGEVLAPAVAAAYAGTDGAALPGGSSVRLDAALFRADGDRATVPMEVSGPDPGRWVLLLAREPGGPWLAYGTRAP